MKRIAIAILLLGGSCFAQTYFPIQGWCEDGGQSITTQGLNSVNPAQASFPSCTVTVYYTGTTNKPTIYSSSTGAALTNPFTANAVNGVWIFYAAGGTGLDVVMSGGIAPITFPAPVTLTNVVPGGSDGFTVANLYLNGSNDIGAAANTACNSLPATGGTVYFLQGYYSNGTTITNNGKDCNFIGQGPGAFEWSNLFGTSLVWTGTGGTEMSISGSNVQSTVMNLGFDNTGTAAVGLDIDALVNHVFVDNVTMFPQVDFSTAFVRAGHTGNVVDVNINKSSFRRSTKGTLLLATQVNAKFVSVQTRWIGGTVQLGDGSNGPTNFVMIGDSIEPGVDQDGILINRCTACTFRDNYWEFGYDGTGSTTYLVHIPSTANIALKVLVSGGFVNGGDAASTTYAFDTNLSTAGLTVENTYFTGFANPAHIVNVESAAAVSVNHTWINSAGMDIFSGGGGTTSCGMDNRLQATAAWSAEWDCTPTLNVTGEVIAPTLALSANVTWTFGTGAPSSGLCTTATAGSLYSRTSSQSDTVHNFYVCTNNAGVAAWTNK